MFIHGDSSLNELLYDVKDTVKISEQLHNSVKKYHVTKLKNSAKI